MRTPTPVANLAAIARNAAAVPSAQAPPLGAAMGLLLGVVMAERDHLALPDLRTEGPGIGMAPLGVARRPPGMAPQGMAPPGVASGALVGDLGSTIARSGGSEEKAGTGP